MYFSLLPLIVLTNTVYSADTLDGDDPLAGQIDEATQARCRLLMAQHRAATSKIERLTKLGKSAPNAEAKKKKLEDLGKSLGCAEFYFVDGPVFDIPAGKGENTEIVQQMLEERIKTECPRLIMVMEEQFASLKETNFERPLVRENLDQTRRSMREIGCPQIDEIADEQDDELLDICDKFSKELTELNKFLNKSREKKLRKQIEIAGCSELGNIDDVWVFVVAGKDPKMIESINQEDPNAFCNGLTEQLGEMKEELETRKERDPQSKRKRTQTIETIIPVLEEMVAQFKCEATQ